MQYKHKTRQQVEDEILFKEYTWWDYTKIILPSFIAGVATVTACVAILKWLGI